MVPRVSVQTRKSLRKTIFAGSHSASSAPASLSARESRKGANRPVSLHGLPDGRRTPVGSSYARGTRSGGLKPLSSSPGARSGTARKRREGAEKAPGREDEQKRRVLTPDDEGEKTQRGRQAESASKTASRIGIRRSATDGSAERSRRRGGQKNWSSFFARSVRRQVGLCPVFGVERRRSHVLGESNGHVCAFCRCKCTACANENFSPRCQEGQTLAGVSRLASPHRSALVVRKKTQSGSRRDFNWNSTECTCMKGTLPRASGAFLFLCFFSP